MTASQLNTHLRDNLLETAPAKVTTAGDLVYATAANALARLAVGAAYKPLRVNSGATAPEWAGLGIVQAITAALTSNVAIGTGLTSIITVNITTVGGSVLVLVTVPYTITASATNQISVDHELRRDSTQLFVGTDDRYQATTAAERLLTLHWWDAAPSAAAHTYELRMLRAAGTTSSGNAYGDAGSIKTRLTVIEFI